MIEIWGSKTSSNVQALMWCIGEIGLPFVRYDIGHRYGGVFSHESERHRSRHSGR